MTISTDDLLALEPGATIINAGRSAGSREIRGAIRYRLDDLLATEHYALPIAHEKPVVLYAASGSRDDLEKIATRMRDDGFTDVRVLDASLDDYERAGGPTQEPSVEQTIPPHSAEEAAKLDHRW
jgi:rhodanese-related sulfurtransferase